MSPSDKRGLGYVIVPVLANRNLGNRHVTAADAKRADVTKAACAKLKQTFRKGRGTTSEQAQGLNIAATSLIASARSVLSGPLRLVARSVRQPRARHCAGCIARGAAVPSVVGGLFCTDDGQGIEGQPKRER